MERLLVTRRQILKAGAVGVAGMVLAPAAALAAEGEDRQAPMGPFSPWSSPVNLGPVVNTKFTEVHPAISRDGLSLYISSDRPGGFGDSDIWASQRETVDAPWGSPSNLGPNINTVGNEFAPDFSPDGHWLFFSRATASGSKDATIWASYRNDRDDDLGWEPAVKLAGEINHPGLDQNAPTFFHDGETDTTTIYFNSQLRHDGPGDFDIYASTLAEDGTWGPGVVVLELCSPQRDTRTAIRRDGLEMFITSARPGGSGGNDLWVATRQSPTLPWGKPENLGPTVNSAFDDGGPALSADGTTLYFYSARPGGFGARDLYVITRTRLEPGVDSEMD